VRGLGAGQVIDYKAQDFTQVITTTRIWNSANLLPISRGF